MREVTVKVYQYSELSDKAKEKARQWFLEGMDSYWYDSTYEDAKQVGIEITGFDIDRGSYCNIEFIKTPEKIAGYIIGNHGNICDTYKDSETFISALNQLKIKYPSDDERNSDEYEEASEELVAEYKNALSQSYLVMLRKEYEYQTSEECIAEGMEANEYEFTEDGKRL